MTREVFKALKARKGSIEQFMADGGCIRATPEETASAYQMAVSQIGAVDELLNMRFDDEEA